MLPGTPLHNLWQHSTLTAVLPGTLPTASGVITGCLLTENQPNDEDFEDLELGAAPNQ